MLERCRRVIGGKADAELRLSHRQLGIVGRRRQEARRQFRRALPAAQYPAISDAVVALRENVMGQMIPTGLDAPVRLAHLLQDGVHVGMLVDQHFTKGVDVTFFGRTCKANPLIALLARQVECPIIGLRVVRLPDGKRFSGEITDPIEPPRDAEGRIDIQGTMQAITAVIEGWVREHPEPMAVAAPALAVMFGRQAARGRQTIAPLRRAARRQLKAFEQGEHG